MPKVPDYLVEKAKSDFAGPELMGKTIGVLGLGATGAMVANIALEIGMKVLGYDPFMSVEAAWMLSREVIHVDDLDEVFAKSDGCRNSGRRMLFTVES